MLVMACASAYGCRLRLLARLGSWQHSATSCIVHALRAILQAAAGFFAVPLQARVAPPPCAFPTRHCSSRICTCIGCASAGGGWVPLCRCRRAWLPPASTWLFPPRSALHVSGGWYFEWLGYAGSCSPLCASWLCDVDGNTGV